MVKKKTTKSNKLLEINSNWQLIESGKTLSTMTKGVEYVIGKNPTTEIIQPNEIRRLRPYLEIASLATFAYFRCITGLAFLYIGNSQYDTIGGSVSNALGGGGVSSVDGLSGDVDLSSKYRTESQVNNQILANNGAWSYRIGNNNVTGVVIASLATQNLATTAINLGTASYDPQQGNTYPQPALNPTAGVFSLSPLSATQRNDFLITITTSVVFSGAAGGDRQIQIALVRPSYDESQPDSAPANSGLIIKQINIVKLAGTGLVCGVVSFSTFAKGDNDPFYDGFKIVAINDTTGTATIEKIVIEFANGIIYNI